MIPEKYGDQLKLEDPEVGDTWAHRVSGLSYRIRGLALGQSSREEAGAQVREIQTKLQQERYCEGRILVLYERGGTYFARPLDEFTMRFRRCGL